MKDPSLFSRIGNRVRQCVGIQLLVAVACLLSLPTFAFAATEPPIGKMDRDIKPANRIQGLEWTNWTMVQVKSPTSDALTLGVRLDGMFNRPGWSLMWPGQYVEMPQNTPFNATIPLTGDVTTISLMAIGPAGEIVKEECHFVLPQSAWAAILKNLEAKANSKRFFVTPGVQVTYLHYHEEPTGIDLDQFVVTAKVAAVVRAIPHVLDFSANIFMTGFPIYWNQSVGPWARFYGINLRGVYTIPKRLLNAEWSVHAGAFFWGMWVQDNAYGISSLFGPQLLINGRWARKSGEPIWFYIKYSPLTDGAAAYDFLTYEIAGGGGIQLTPLGKPRPISLTLDISYLAAASVLEGNTVRSYQASLGVQMGF